MNTEHYQVTGMTCGGCVARVQATLAAHAEKAVVTLQPPTAILSNATADMATLNLALSRVGHYALQTVVETTEIHNEIDTEIKKNLPVSESPHSWFSTYYPLLLIISFILLVSVLAEFSPTNALQSFNSHRWMMHFMAGFFLVFSFFKLLDIKSFANSYAMYDLLAMRVPAYGFIYPFIELGLGMAYLLAWQPTLVNSVALIVMTFSSLGVIRSVIHKQKIRCACLGSVFNLPMSTVTIIEDLTMAGMALWMLL